MQLSVLDLFPVGADSTPTQAIQRSAELAQAADRLGYLRYWVAEHHNMPSIATSSPEVLIAHLASKTSRIRVGAGGIMLPNHTPLRIVEIFRTLEALYPGRIDLGLGRAPGTDPVAAHALQRGNEDPNSVLAEVLAFENRTFPKDHPYAQITPMPSDVKLPPIFMLGSTFGGAQIAAQLGTHYAFAGHFMMKNARDAIGLYRDRFKAGAIAKPYAILAATVICGETDAHAEELATPVKVAVVRNITGRPGPVPSLADARAYRFNEAEQQVANEFFNGAVIGGPDKVREGLRELLKVADEVMISSLVPSHEERLRSYERICAHQ